MREIFEAVIAANPLDEIAHLAFADWLEEQGDCLEADRVRNPPNLYGTNYWRQGHRRYGYGESGGYGGSGGSGGYGGSGGSG
jgi:uncharacterized protein (TIGR02996 family)